MSSGRQGFQSELEGVINRYSMENGSNTPDWVLAEYMRKCLEAFDAAVQARDKWYGVWLRPGAGNVSAAASSVIPTEGPREGGSEK